MRNRDSLTTLDYLLAADHLGALVYLSSWAIGCFGPPLGITLSVGRGIGFSVDSKGLS